MHCNYWINFVGICYIPVASYLSKSFINSYTVPSTYFAVKNFLCPSPIFSLLSRIVLLFLNPNLLAPSESFFKRNSAKFEKNLRIVLVFSLALNEIPPCSSDEIFDPVSFSKGRPWYFKVFQSSIWLFFFKFL